MSHVNRIADRIQRRFRSARPGSVLILVVALLVLMALLGTAFISSARTDRYSAVQHAINTEIDLLVEGMVNQAVATITGDLYGVNPATGEKQYRPTDPLFLVQPNGYEHHDSSFFDLWLADRIPTVANPELASAVGPGGNAARFLGVSFPLAFNNAANTGYQFDRPDDGPSVPLPVFVGTGATPRRGYQFIPHSLPLLGQTEFPHLQIVYPTGARTDLPAADADGDGIADAGLWKIPVGTIDGVTYYAAFRIIDHNSAINVNTALSRSRDFTGTGAAALNYGFFSGGTGLAELLRTWVPTATTITAMGTEFDALNRYRFHTTTPAAYVPPHGITGGPGEPVAADHATMPPTRTDFDFVTVGDALHHQLARRLLNPGMSTATPQDRFKAFGFADQAALAYRFCLVNLDASPSPLEQAMITATGGPPPTGSNPQNQWDSVYKNAPNYVDPANRFRQYAANQVKAWYDAIADYRVEVEPTATPDDYLNRRTILTTRNPVANQMAAFGSRDPLTGNILPAAAGMKAYSRKTTSAFLNDPLPPNPPKTNINTAEFAELWRGFWNVMAETSGTAPVEADILISGVIPLDPYQGQGFGTAAGTSVGAAGPTKYANQALEQHPARMFRSSIRDPRAGLFNVGTGARLSPQNQLLLRAAIAAVNAEDLRDSDYNVTLRDIVLPVSIDGADVNTTITVYGTERQPFISEVYVNTDNLTPGDTAGPNPNGYIAIELSNPYPDPIKLGPDVATNQGWTVGMIDRRGPSQLPLPTPRIPGGAQLTVQPVLNPTEFPVMWRFPAGTVIPGATAAGPGKLLLENYDPTGGGINTEDAATHRPPDVVLTSTALLETEDVDNLLTVYVPGLHRVLQSAAGATLDPSTGGEFVLLRTASAEAIGAGDEITGAAPLMLSNMIPVDSFDFTGALRPPAAAPPFLWMHYVRENGPGFNGRLVYPGRYDAAQTLTPTAVAPHEDSRHQGVQMHVMTGPNIPPVAIEKPILLLMPDPVVATAPYTNPFTIQLNSADFGGPNKIGAVTPAQFPFGTFARNGDILQVPFIGAYTMQFNGTGPVPGGILEMNSVSMDSVFAEDTDIRDDPTVAAETGRLDREQIGRFYPLALNPPRSPTANAQQIDDFYEDGEYFNNPDAATNSVDNWANAKPTNTAAPFHKAQWRYRWAADLLDYFTVQGPNEDFFPNFSTRSAPGYAPPPTPVSNTGGTAGDTTETTPDDTNDHAEDAVGVDGLININTASWRVLSMLPMVVDPATGAIDVPNNNALAKAIVYWRDVDGDPHTTGDQPHGPFKNLHELNQVEDLRPVTHGGPAPVTLPDRLPGFRNAYKTMDPVTNTAEPGDEAGDVSPLGTELDGVRHDFEERTLTLNRISNLVTTRSDMFTCYLLVQGWRDAGTANASLVVQRRVAFIVDRSETTPSANPQAKVTYVPNN